MPSDDAIAAFDAAHGFDAFERCRVAEKLARAGKFKLGAGGEIKPHHLERQGISPALSAAYCSLLYPPPRAGRMKPGARRHAIG